MPMASLLERLQRGRLLRSRWKSTPRAMRISFYAAVFALFASVEVLVLLMGTTYLSPLQIFLNIVIFGGFSIAYAAVWIWQRYWLIPVLMIGQGVLSAVVSAHFYHMGSQLIAAGSPIQRQLRYLGSLVLSRW